MFPDLTGASVRETVMTNVGVQSTVLKSLQAEVTMIDLESARNLGRAFR